MIIITKRLRLRPMTAGDAPALFAILGDEEAMRFWHRPALPRLATVEALLADELAAMAAGGFHYWMAEKDGDAIGGVDLSHADGDGADIGFLFRRDQWGKGYGLEAAAGVIAHAFGPLGLTRLGARVRTGNERALALLARLGFQDVDMEGAVVRLALTRSATQNGT